MSTSPTPPENENARGFMTSLDPRVEEIARAIFENVGDYEREEWETEPQRRRDYYTEAAVLVLANLDAVDPLRQQDAGARIDALSVAADVARREVWEQYDRLDLEDPR